MKPQASLPRTQEQSNERAEEEEEGGRPEAGGREGVGAKTWKDAEIDREWKMNKKNDRAGLTIKQTLELDFLFWQTAMERRREKK